jgi:hypothetical protein
MSVPQREMPDRLHYGNLRKFVLFTTYNYNDQMEENEMGGACGTKGEEVAGRKARGKETTRKTKT